MGIAYEESKAIVHKLNMALTATVETKSREPKSNEMRMMTQTDLRGILVQFVNLLKKWLSGRPPSLLKANKVLEQACRTVWT